MKWGIEYKRRVYFQVYGKKKAHEMHYRLSRCVNGLTVVPLMTVRRLGRRTTNRDKPNVTANT